MDQINYANWTKEDILGQLWANYTRYRTDLTHLVIKMHGYMLMYFESLCFSDYFANISTAEPNLRQGNF